MNPLVAGLLLASALAQEPEVRFRRVQLASEFTCEGATFADLDRDGDQDVIAGPLWYEAPDFQTVHEIRQAHPFDPHGYSDSFFLWPTDVDGDGWTDLLEVGFPGKEAYWYRNPFADPEKHDTSWERFVVHPAVDNESPAFADLFGD